MGKAMNKGLIIPERHKDDLVQGTAKSLEVRFGALPLQPDGNWEEHLPASEKQAPGYETSACVTFATLTAIEILANRKFKDKKNLSDRFVAKLSGTDPSAGNDPKKVAQFIRDNWSVLESEWATEDAHSTEEFYADVPKEKKTLAAARGAEYEFGYEWTGTNLESIKEALRHSPVCFSVPAWYERDGRYYRPNGVSDGHWTTGYDVNKNDEIRAEDSYPPHKKIMEKGYIPTIAMRYYLEKKVVSDKWYDRFLRLVKRVIRQMQYGISQATS